MKISVITITWNAAATLPPTLKSVAEQTCRDFEHIIIDGASTDNTLDIARKSGIPELRIISEPDKGLYDAMNKGLMAAKGDFVIFLNAGDSFAAPDTLQKYCDAASDKADIIYGDTLIVDCNRHITGKRHLSAPDILTRKSFSKGMLICHQAFMVRRELAPKYNLTYRFSADYDWTVKCISATSPKRCINLRQPTIHYLSDGLTDHNKLASLKERFRIMCRHYGPVTATMRNLSFIPRAVGRRFSHAKDNR